MAIDPRTPVIVGVGQFVNRELDLVDPLGPVDLMERAVAAAVTDAGLDATPSAGSVRVVTVIGWRYRNAPRFLAKQLWPGPSTSRCIR
jgi:acetyl-CoA C-acetyltransferase